MRLGFGSGFGSGFGFGLRLGFGLGFGSGFGLGRAHLDVHLRPRRQHEERPPCRLVICRGVAEQAARRRLARVRVTVRVRARLKFGACEG